MKPVVLPMLHLLRVGYDGDSFAWDVSLVNSWNPQNALVFVREDFDEPGNSFVPVFKDPLGTLAAGELRVTANEIADELHILYFHERFEINRLEIAAVLGEISVFVEDVRDAAAHSGGEVTAAGTEHNHQAVRHVFTAVIANTLDDCGRTGIANREPLSTNAVEENFAAGGAVECNVPDDDVLLRGKCRSARRIYNDSPAGQTLADVIVGFAFQSQPYAFG